MITTCTTDHRQLRHLAQGEDLGFFFKSPTTDHHVGYPPMMLI